ncbi:Por secretion system C-terminal sorting domain-containing protein [Candidatus Kryptonium thompsonii]|uniref:phospholipase D n=2 Tax=Candidatus Kryptonium thompsonii TaxID=1633631 RepID=A0A0P1LBT9_9BACT|nr:phospholipase D-like domain-containing protein [Candidatus Kryptonium thompsoni]CUS78652.1 Por secretion system C-terminal sorting domain-containing protein [Candidatus Kryptonium thompsoni]CUS79566.1 Por secretion system C-terminal sorting domain-containing protein [Candidatus Kryptonium thompsoni]CUS83860.1 Por secretion system C-terminal sorting domain-containing protein [Candidatus Kryptonium thompsoni]CUS84645.1 Por secretion system C-terminal sorting domain-containing protein [Candidat
MMKRLLLLFLFLFCNLYAQIVKVSPYEKYVDSTKITFFWKTISVSDSRVKIGKTPNFEIGEFVDTTKTKDHEITITGLEPATIYYVQIASYGIFKDSIQFISSTSSDSRSTGRINVYFNKSIDTTVSIWQKATGNVDLKAKLIERINQARYSIDICIYNFSGTVASQIADALVNAKNRGVKIRFITEKENYNLARTGYSKLINAGIPILADNTDGYMHNKFVVIDYRDPNSWDNVWVITGSWNFTDEGTYRDFQNVIEIQDRAIAGAFTREFEEMWGGSGDLPDTSKSKFGANKTDNTPHFFNIKGKKVEVYFSPSDEVASKIVNAINQADHSIFFALLTFTSQTLSNALYTRYNSGVRNIKGILDNNTDQGSQYSFLSGFSEVLLDTDKTALFHHKYCLIDPTHIYSNPILITGSYNWSNSAEARNDENVLIIYDTLLVNLYLQEFVARYKQNGGGNVITSARKIEGESLSFKLSPNYPNPFNSETNITYAIPFDGFVSLKVFDVLGREVFSVVNSYQTAGEYRLNLKFDNVNLGSGVYFYRLELYGSGQKLSDTKKMIVIK